jgi:DNA-binding XRE family transcriptional regulator
LANAAGLSLRTIQRVETNGAASPETVQSLAAVFNCSVEDLFLTQQNSSMEQNPLVQPVVRASQNGRRKFTLAICGIVSGLALGFGVIRTAHATDIHLNVRILFNDRDEGIHGIVVKAGEPALIEYAGRFKLSITPTIDQQQRVFLKTLWSEFDAAAQPTRFTLTAQPTLLVENQKKASFGMTIKTGEAMKIEITPEVSRTKP